MIKLGRGVRPHEAKAVRRTAAGIDWVAVVLFVVIGRSSHHHALTVGGFISTAWPFLVGLAAGWLAVKGRSLTSLRGGAIVCGITVVVGMTLRVVVGQGTAFAFILVALAFLGAMMIGGRLLLARCGQGQ